jgi:hypothetical protein
LDHLHVARAVVAPACDHVFEVRTPRQPTAYVDEIT